MKKGKTTLILLIVAMLLSGAAGGYFLFGVGKGQTEANLQEKPGVPLPAVELTTNLADPGGRHLIQIEVEFEARDAKVAKHLGERMMGIKDATITVLRSKTFEQVSAQGSMEELRREILAAVNDFLGQPDIKDLRFGRFIVQ